MKWKYETAKEASERLSEWHSWFAWYPVFNHGKGAWLTTVKRKAIVFELPYEQQVMHWEYDI